MRVFVTGATGFIGSALVRDLLDAGHEAVGLARSDAAAAALTAAGAQVHRGDLDDLDSLREGAAAADGVVHLAFNNDFAQFAASAAVELRAVETVGAALDGSGKPFVAASGTLVVASNQLAAGLATEEDPGAGDRVPRTASSRAILALAERGVRSSIVRLAPCVHDLDRQGLGTTLFAVARAKGVSAFVGDGANRWPGVHRLDAARLFRLAVEAAPAGTRLHAADEEGVPFREIAEAIGRRLNVPVRGIPAEEAAGHFGMFASFVTLDNPTSSALTRERLGWKPQGPGLIADLEQANLAEG